MKKIILFISGLILAFSLAGCKTETQKDNKAVASEIPAIVFLVRTDISDIIYPEEIEGQDIPVRALCFYDKDGNYYISTDSDVNAMDNKTLIAEYEAGNLTEKIQSHKICDKDALANQYNKFRQVCLKEQFGIVYPDALPAVQAESSAWYGYYFDENGDLQYQTIHQNERMSELYTNNDTVNQVYEWIIGTFKTSNTEQP